MREILFRAKRISDGEWVEGYYAIARDRRGLEQHNILITDNKHGYFGWHEINPETVCQYTGLTDKHGNKIWENDIVKHYYYVDHPHLYHFGKVIYSKMYCRFLLKHKDDREYSLNRLCDYEVIGNIFDNPELLKGE